MKVGIAVADITPAAGITLSGFVARQNQPSEQFADSLSVKCLALQGGGNSHLLFAFDLLGIGSELLGQLQAELAGKLGKAFSPFRAVFASTHTHSAPATVHLEGCGFIETSYWEQVKQATARAAQLALADPKEASLRVAQRRIDGLAYNRRRILEDGTVSMAIEPKQRIASVGPVDGLLTLLGWCDAGGKYLAAGIHFACHPVINGSQTGTAEFCGGLCRHIETLLGAPCFFLQGAAGDINPIYIAQGCEEVVRFVDQLIGQLTGIEREMKPVTTTEARSACTMVPLHHARGFDSENIRREMEQLEVIARWNPGASSATESLRAMADIMNCDPEKVEDPATHVFNARTLAGCARKILAATEEELPPCPLFTAVWDLGGLQFHFAGAELFASTGLELKKLAPSKFCLPIGYCAPFVGYLPTREATKQGGYEVDYAWRYFGHLAPFTADSEERVRETFQHLQTKLR